MQHCLTTRCDGRQPGARTVPAGTPCTCGSSVGSERWQEGRMATARDRNLVLVRSASTAERARAAAAAAEHAELERKAKSDDEQVVHVAAQIAAVRYQLSQSQPAAASQLENMSLSRHTLEHRYFHRLDRLYFHRWKAAALHLRAGRHCFYRWLAVVESARPDSGAAIFRRVAYTERKRRLIMARTLCNRLQGGGMSSNMELRLCPVGQSDQKMGFVERQLRKEHAEQIERMQVQIDKLQARVRTVEAGTAQNDMALDFNTGSLDVPTPCTLARSASDSSTIGLNDSPSPFWSSCSYCELLRTYPSERDYWPATPQLERKATLFAQLQAAKRRRDLKVIPRCSPTFLQAAQRRLAFALAMKFPDSGRSCGSVWAQLDYDVLQELRHAVLCALEPNEISALLGRVGHDAHVHLDTVMAHIEKYIDSFGTGFQRSPTGEWVGGVILDDYAEFLRFGSHDRPTLAHQRFRLRQLHALLRYYGPDWSSQGIHQADPDDKRRYRHQLQLDLLNATKLRLHLLMATLEDALPCLNKLVQAAKVGDATEVVRQLAKRVPVDHPDTVDVDPAGRPYLTPSMRGVADKWTALMHAAAWGHGDCVELLLEADADPELCDGALCYTLSPLAIALEFQNTAIVRLLQGAIDRKRAVLAQGH